MNVYIGQTPGTCGLGVIHGFNSNFADIEIYGRPISTIVPQGAGFSVAGFIKTKKCKLAYTELAKKFEMVYQSPVRKNRNTGHRFFFVIYDTTKSKEN